MNNFGVWITCSSKEVITVYLTTYEHGKAIWKTVFVTIYNLPKMIEKRKSIQKNKKIKPGELLKVMSTGLFEPLQEFIHRNKGK